MVSPDHNGLINKTELSHQSFRNAEHESNGRIPWWHHGMETISTSIDLCMGDLSMVDSLHKGPVMWIFDAFFVVIMNRLLNSWSVGNMCDVIVMLWPELMTSIARQHDGSISRFENMTRKYATTVLHCSLRLVSVFGEEQRRYFLLTWPCVIKGNMTP